MDKLNDLRFIIGLFFSIVGAVLVVLPLFSTDSKTYGFNLNLFAGGAMLVLGIGLLWASGKQN